VAIDVLSIHFDPELWGDDVNQFNPDRFSPETKHNPLAFMTFGVGPRNCIGLLYNINFKLNHIIFILLLNKRNEICYD
jgi:cytochrome P450